MRLKVCDSHLTCKVENKCLNVRQRVEVVDWNRIWSPPFPGWPVIRQCPWQKSLREKKVDLKFKGKSQTLIWTRTRITWLVIFVPRRHSFVNIHFSTFFHHLIGVFLFCDYESELNLFIVKNLKRQGCLNLKMSQ